MSDVIDISLDTLSSRKKVKIGDTVYTVRRLGAGEELDINQIIRELDKISKRTDGEKMSDEDQEKFLNLQEKSLRLYAGTFDDGSDGKKSYALIKSLSYEDRAIIHEKIFGLSQVKQGAESGKND